MKETRLNSEGGFPNALGLPATGAPNENIVQNHLNIELLNIF